MSSIVVNWKKIVFLTAVSSVLGNLKICKNHLRCFALKINIFVFLKNPETKKMYFKKTFGVHCSSELEIWKYLWGRFA